MTDKKHMITFLCKKLVRNNSIKRMEKRGAITHYRHLKKDELPDALGNKLVEEAAEVKDAQTKNDIVSELADVFEVIDAIMKLYNIAQEDVIKAKKEKLLERGDFSEGIFLDKVTVDPDSDLISYLRSAPDKYIEER